MCTRALFVVSTPSQIATFDAVLRSEVEQKSDLVPLFVSLEQFYSQNGTHNKLVQTGWPYAVLCNNQDYTRFFRSPDWRRIRAVTVARRALTKLINEFSPDIVVLGNDIGPIEKLCIDVARRRTLPTLLVQDGILSNDSVEDYGPTPRSPGGYLRRGSKFLSRWFLSCLGVLPMPTKYGGGGCDLIAAMGPDSRDVLIRKGAVPERIIITGQPRFDALAHVSREQCTKDTCTQSGGKGVLLYTSVWLSSALSYVAEQVDLLTIKHISYVADALRETHEIWLRPHPADDPKSYQVALESLGQDQIKIVAGDLWDQIRRCDLVITYASTTGIEAVALGKPLVTFSPLGGPEVIPYAASGVGIFAGDGTALLSAVKEALFSSTFRSRFQQARIDFLQRFLGDFDGRSAYRVRALIVELSGK